MSQDDYVRMIWLILLVMTGFVMNGLLMNGLVVNGLVIYRADP